MKDSPLTREEVVRTVEFMLGRRPADEAELDRLLALGTPGRLRYYLAGYEEYSLDSVTRRAFEIAQIRRLRAKPLPVQVTATDEELAQLLRATEGAWEQLGQQEPFWSVVTSEEFRASRIGETREAFFVSGESEVDIFLRFLERAGVEPGDFNHLLEVGCGVGRMTQYFARHFPKVSAIDISESHLRLAQARMASLGVSNVSFERVRKPIDYLSVGGYDIACSFIVLQHSPPPIIRLILDALFDNLRRGGVVYFQVPTFIEGYSFSIDTYLRSTKGEMEMHCIPQATVFDLMRAHGVHPVEVVNDGSGGDYRFESCRFLGRKAQRSLRTHEWQR